ncbi:MAG: hypothetical protein AAFZ07_20135 [Actinomycetota bacterium]
MRVTGPARHVCSWLGTALVVAGLWLMWPPIALLAAGVVLLLVAGKV